ncbi:MAG: hypothetical protein K2K26_10505 [Muribaculaceae bacterium]|nr:hypothetical protein [Muribaculaceae bacterium]
MKGLVIETLLRPLLATFSTIFSDLGLTPKINQTFLDAITDRQKTIRLKDFNRWISKNIKDVCESFAIQCVTPQYTRNSFISALGYHGVMSA